LIAIDTNILVYAHREDSQWYRAADERLTELAESGDVWAIPWPCIHEFLAIVTHPRIFNPPTPLPDAITQVDCWLECPSLIMLGENANYWREIRTVLEQSLVTGPTIHDARVAALCRQHGVTELWTADRDFGRFKGLSVANPLIE
jgi:toxin-antitoxin system PIN domain toxin